MFIANPATLSLSAGVATRRSTVKFTALACTLLCSIILLAQKPALATKVGSVTLEQSITLDDVVMQLNGAGMRSRLFFKLYVGSLYVDESLKGRPANELIAADAPMLVQLNVLSDLLTRDKFVAALDDGFKKATNGNTAAIDNQITQMKNAVQQPIKPGDVFRIAYHPELGTRMTLGDELLATFEGMPFKQALFGIWLSDKPVQKSLKAAMLGL